MTCFLYRSGPFMAVRTGRGGAWLVGWCRELPCRKSDLRLAHIAARARHPKPLPPPTSGQGGQRCCFSVWIAGDFPGYFARFRTILPALRRSDRCGPGLVCRFRMSIQPLTSPSPPGRMRRTVGSCVSSIPAARSPAWSASYPQKTVLNRKPSIRAGILPVAPAVEMTMSVRAVLRRVHAESASMAPFTGRAVSGAVCRTIRKPPPAFRLPGAMALKGLSGQFPASSATDFFRPGRGR